MSSNRGNWRDRDQVFLPRRGKEGKGGGGDLFEIATMQARGETTRVIRVFLEPPEPERTIRWRHAFASQHATNYRTMRHCFPRLSRRFASRRVETWRDEATIHRERERERERERGRIPHFSTDIERWNREYIETRGMAWGRSRRFE